MPALATFSLSAAERFVLTVGLPWQQAYWKAAFGWGPVETVIAELTQYQHADGGWTDGLLHGKGTEVSLAGTMAAMRLLTWLNLGDDLYKVWPRTLAFVLSAQQPDGTWSDGRGAAERAFLTAGIGAYLRRSGGAPDAVLRATRHIVAAGPDAIESLTARGLVLALCADGAVPGAAQLAEGCELELTASLATGTPPAAQLAWLHEATRQAGLPVKSRLRHGLWRALASQQRTDGGFVDRRGSAHVVDTTLAASRALVGP